MSHHARASDSLKILFVARSLDRGGAERYLVSLSAGLRGRGHEVSIAVFYPGGAFEDEARAADVEVVDLAKRGRWDLAAFLARWVRLVRARRPDVVYGMLANPSLVALLARPVSGARVIWGVQNTGFDAVATDWLDRVVGRIEAIGARGAWAVVSNSESGRHDLVQRGLSPGKIHVIPNGVDLARFQRDPAAGAAFRAAWGFERTAAVVGLVGRVDPVKDVPTFLRAAERLAAADDSVRFVVIGPGPPEYMAELSALAAQLGVAERLVWAGPVDDMPSAFSAIDVLASSSVSEGMPNVVVEAMSCGVPCAVTDVGDCAEVVGDTGAVVAVGDDVELSKGAADLLRCLAIDELGTRRRARARIEAHYTLDGLVSSTEALLERARSVPR